MFKNNRKESNKELKFKVLKNVVHKLSEYGHTRRKIYILPVKKNP